MKSSSRWCFAWLVTSFSLVGCGEAPREPAAPAEPLAVMQSAISAGATQLPNVAFAHTPTLPSQVRHVAVGGCSNLNGACSNSNDGLTRATAWRTIQYALSNMPGGTTGSVLYVHREATAFRERIDIARTGLSTAPFFVVGVPNSSGDMPEVLPLYSSGAWRSPLSVNAGGAYYVFDGLHIDCENKHNLRADGKFKPVSGISLFDADHVVIRNSMVRNCGAGVSVSGSDDVSIDNNKLFDLHDWPTTGEHNGGRGDANAVVLERGSTRVLIQGNNSGSNTGDGVQCTGVEQENNVGLPPVSQLTIRNNSFGNEDENGVDIKSCEDVTISGNEMSGYKHALGNGGTCGGPAIVIHYFAKRVLVEDNRLHHSGAGVIVGSAEPVTTLPPPNNIPRVEDVVIRRNRIWAINQDLSNSKHGCGDGVKLQHFKGVEVYHNTFDDLKRSGVRIDPDSTATSQDVHVWNNIIQNAQGFAPSCSDFTATGCATDKTGGALDLSGPVTNASIHHNLYWGAGGSAAARFRLNASYGLGFTSWASLASDTNSSEQDPVLLPFYRLGASSPAINTASADASNTGPGQRCASAPDKGALESDCVPAALWKDQQGGHDTDGFADVTVTSTGDVWVVGSTTSSSTFGGVELGGSDAFFGRYSSTGTRSPVVRFGTDGFDYASGIARDANDNIIVVGETTGNLFATKAGSLYSYDAFIVKYDPTGTTVLWSRQFGSAADDGLMGVAVDPSTGDIYAVGYTYGALDGLNQGGSDAILVKYDANGSQQWIEQSGTPAYDRSSNIKLGGGALAILGRRATQGVSHDVIIHHGLTKNSVQWTLGEPSASNVSYGRPTVDGSGNVFVPVTYQNYPDNGAALRKYSSTGALSWSTSWTSGDWGQAAAVSLDTSGNPMVVGKNYDDGERFWKFDSSGTLVWSGGLTNAIQSQSHAVAPTPTGGFAVVGMTYTTGLFGTSGGWEDGWIAVLP